MTNSNYCCNRCGSRSCGGDCDCQGPAAYDCFFDIHADPFDNSKWVVTWNGMPHKVTVPTIKETDTFLSTDYSNATLNYKSEYHTDTITGAQIGDLINLDDLRDVVVEDGLPGNCYELIYHKWANCGDGCKSLADRWQNFNINSEGAKQNSISYIRGANEFGCPVYLDKPDNCSFLIFSPSCISPTGEWQAWKIPRAGDCEMVPDDNGRYRVLTLDDCGCPKECRLPVMPSGMTALNYQRDSVPDDPDFPWYYGCYNDRINLHLRDNAPDYFGKYDLKVTINYGVQAIKSDNYTFNYNWRSLVVPVVDGTTIRTDMAASILQNWSMAGSISGGRDIPWGSASLRGSFTFVVPRGQEAYLHHEWRVRTSDSFPNYKLNPTYDGKRVPDSEATLNAALWPASRLNALQVLIEPTFGSTDYDPVKDEYRSQLDPPVDSLPQSF